MRVCRCILVEGWHVFGAQHMLNTVHVRCPETTTAGGSYLPRLQEQRPCRRNSWCRFRQNFGFLVLFSQEGGV